MHYIVAITLKGAACAASPCCHRRLALPASPPMMSDERRGPGNDTSILTKTKTKTERPPLYKVLLLNDDYTPMEFVVHVLER